MSPADLIVIDDPAPHVRRLTLNRPEKRNALSNGLLSELFKQLRRADADREVSVVVLRGNGPCWSAGYDLAQTPEDPPARHVAPFDGWWSRHVVEGWFEIWDYSTPVIAQVHGWCLAGGTELATACDLVYVAHDAAIGYPPVRRMSSPDMAWQPWLLGFRRGMEAMLTGDAMTGTEAVASGFANRAFPADELEAEVLAVAERIAKIPIDLLVLNKRVVHRAMEAMGIRAGIRNATEIQALGLHQRASKDFFRALADDVTDALSKRDSPFGDYRVGFRAREPG